MSKLDRLNKEIAIFEKLLFSAMASLLAVIGWIVSNYTTANTILLMFSAAAVVLNAGGLVFVYRRIKYLLREIEKC